MRKHLLWAFTALLTLTLFTACDEDHAIAYDLEGQWQGDFGMYYEYESHGRIYRYDSYDTDIRFVPSSSFSTHGYGYQIDWYTAGPYDYMSMQFEWQARNGAIYLHYPYNPDWDAVIYDYRLNDYYFSGYFGDTRIHFSLRKIDGYYDWDAYDYTYPWPYWRSAGRDNASTDATEGRIVRIGNRWAEQGK